MNQPRTDPGGSGRRGARRVAVGVARRLRRVSPVRRRPVPLVSVVLPVFQVEAYLGRCLDSIAAQSFTDYELVVVDDGSRDRSRSIAEEYAASDARIRIVTRENGGLGAARNTGVRHARGRYLTFVDSDDLLPPGALRALVSSAEATGSDIVTGSIRRFNSLRTWPPSWVADVHGEQRERIRIEEFPPLLRNLYTWNKLFRKDFWDAQGLWFREGVAYEDQPLVTQLFARAAAIDVLTDVVYHYRVREDASSISQQTATLRDLRDRVLAWRTTREALLQETSRPVYLGWLQTLFDAHFHWYLAGPGTDDDGYWRELRAAVADFTADAPPEIWERTLPDKRVLLELALQDRRSEAQELVRLGAADLDLWPSRVRADGVVVELPFLGDPDLPEPLFLLRPEQLRVAHAVEHVRWVEAPSDEGSLRGLLSGWAFVGKVDLATHRADTSLVLTAKDGTEREYPAEPGPEPAYPPPVDDPWCDCTAGTFQVEVPFGELAAASQPEETWRASLRVRVANLTVTSPVRTLVRAGSAGVVPAAVLPGGARVTVSWRMHEQLRFRLVPPTLEAEQVALQDRVLAATVTGPERAGVRGVSMGAGAEQAGASLDAGGGFRLRVPPASQLVPGRAHLWGVEARTSDGATGPVMYHAPVEEAASAGSVSELVARSNRHGHLVVAEWRVGAEAEHVELTEDGSLRVTGRVRGPAARSVALSSRHTKVRVSGAEVAPEGSRFTAELALRHDVHRFGPQVLPGGDHDLFLLVRPRAGDAVEVPLRVSEHLRGLLPVPVHAARYAGRLVRGREGGLRLTLLRPLGDALSRYRQRVLRTTTFSGVTRGVLMRSYFGELATDNGVSIQRELRRRGSDLPVYWAVQDYSVPVPEGGVPVVVNSRDWYHLLGTVQYYVDNMYQPEYHSKPAHQVLVQTFHGYPFKQMGHPHWRNLRFSQARIDAYDARAKEWDYLVSPARYASPLLRRDFRYDGEVLEIGYPRNDVLLSPEAEEIRAATRASLDIAPGQVAVLYAPTFRDYLAAGDTRAIMPEFFHLDEAAAALGDGFVLLVRGHAFNARTPLRVGAVPGTRDVTDYPEVSDLYLAADAAIVDYSSLRFDFGVTGKPMVFHVPDLQRYHDARGWLFDFEPTAPGPLVDTTEEVVAQLLDLDGVRSRYAEAYARFRDDFLDLEDGLAGRRLVDAVFVPRGDADG